VYKKGLALGNDKVKALLKNQSWTLTPVCEHLTQVTASII
jgi:hypothetical protein